MRPSKASAHAVKVDKRHKQTFAQHRNWHPQVRKNAPPHFANPANVREGVCVVVCEEDEREKKRNAPIRQGVGEAMNKAKKE